MAQAIIRSTVRDAVIRELGVGASDLTADIQRYENQVMREIAAYYKWDWMEELPISLATDSNQNYITKPAYMGDIKAIYQTNGAQEIERIGETEYARLKSQSDITSSLTARFIEQGGRILFWPPLTAGSSVMILCGINAEQFTDDANTDTNEALAEIIPSSFSLIMEWGVLRCLDIAEKKKYWADLYYGELEIKKRQAVRSAAPKVKAVTGPSITGMNKHFITR